jgi:glycosyltransferase involved in cell wall biosynthesis
MRVSFFFRNENVGFSIEKVFAILIKEINIDNNVQIIKTPSPRAMPWDVIINSYYCFKNRDKKGINHITGHIHDAILGLLGCKTILTIHDLVFLDNVKNPIKRLYKWLFWFYLPIKLANKVTCISNQTKVNIEKRIRTNKLVVIYNPIDPTYKYVPKIFNSDKPIILHIGTGWNKNLNRSIEALKDIPCHLRIVGKISLDTINLLKENKIDFSNVFELTDDEIHKEYLNCDIISFSSLYEGFGMPIIEGQAIGRVVLSSEIEPLIEVSGRAVCFVDPIDVISIRNGFLKIIQDSNLRNFLIDKGLQNVQKFDVKKIAQQYVGLYNTI